MQPESIDLRVQELIKLQLGDLILTCANQKATIEALRAELAAVKPAPLALVPDDAH